MKQHHPNRLDATRETGRFWEHLRRAFAGVLSSNPRNPNKPSTLTKLIMTNSQESDSIAEKPEVVKTEPKSNRWNWRQSATAVQACAASGDLIADFLLIGLPIKTQIEPVEEEVEYSEVYQSWSYIYINDKDSNTIAVCAITISNQDSQDSGFYIEIENGRINSWPNYMVYTFMRTTQRVGNCYQQRNCQWAIDYSNPNNISGYLREVWCSLIFQN